MKQVSGVWLPSTEQHFAKALTVPSPGLSFIGETAAYGYDQVDYAIKACKQRRVAVDVGAHVGMWSMWLAPKFGMVHAFEPVEEYRKIFPHNVQMDKVILYPCALGEHEGRVSLRTYPEDTGHTHIDSDEDGDSPIYPLDHFDLPNVDLIKVDVEGYELPVLYGARETLKRCKPIVVVEQRGFEEIHFGADRDEALHWLESIGMRRLKCFHYDWILGW